MSDLSKAMASLIPFRNATDDTDCFISDSKEDIADILRLDKFRKEKKKKSDEDKEDEDYKKVTKFLESEKDSDFNFDAIFDSLDDDNEDSQLKNSLVALGRKYNREGGSKEENDIAAKFSPRTKELDKLILEIDAESKAISTDVQNMRMSRSRNYKSMADLISARGSLFSTKLAAIKEKTNVEKTIVDLQMKAASKNDASNDVTNTATAAVQQLLSGNPIHYEDDITDDDSSAVLQVGDPISAMSDADRVKALFGKSSESDGDKYIKYEDKGVSLYYDYDDEGKHQIVARTKTGEIVPDYPMPTGIDSLTFNVQEDLGVAIDNLNRTYKLEKI